MSYILGDHWVICDRCGFKIRRSKASKTWDGLLVCTKSCWEPRHPQDFVRARADRQSVRDARPDMQDMFGTTAMKVAGSVDDLTVDVDSISGIADGDSIGITLDSGMIQWTAVSGTPAGDTVTLLEALDGAAAIGNVVYIPGDDFLATNEVTQASL